jgi:hypothetical protein
LFGAQFDNNEYASLARLHLEADTALQSCDDPLTFANDLDGLKYEAKFLYTYSKHLPDNVQSVTIAKILLQNVDELDTRFAGGKMSETYCTFKVNFLIQQINRALQAEASKVR